MIKATKSQKVTLFHRHINVAIERWLTVVSWSEWKQRTNVGMRHRKCKIEKSQKVALKSKNVAKKISKNSENNWTSTSELKDIGTSDGY